MCCSVPATALLDKVSGHAIVMPSANSAQSHSLVKKVFRRPAVLIFTHRSGVAGCSASRVSPPETVHSSLCRPVRRALRHCPRSLGVRCEVNARRSVVKIQQTMRALQGVQIIGEDRADCALCNVRSRSSKRSLSRYERRWTKVIPVVSPVATYLRVYASLLKSPRRASRGGFSLFPAR